MANAIENPALAQIDNPPLTGRLQTGGPLPALATDVPTNPPLPPATGSVVRIVSDAKVPDFSTGQSLVPGVSPQIENPELD